jgi:hypothetical protein
MPGNKVSREAQGSTTEGDARNKVSREAEERIVSTRRKGQTFVFIRYAPQNFYSQVQ